MPMSPSILEMAKKDIAEFWVETTFTIGLSLPKVCEPSIASVEIKPTLHDQNKSTYLRIDSKDIFQGTKSTSIGNYVKD